MCEGGRREEKGVRKRRIYRKMEEKEQVQCIHTERCLLL